MKAVGEAAIDLPWLAPCVRSLTALAGSPLSAVWPRLKADPGLALLVARTWGLHADRPASFECDLELLDLTLRQLQEQTAAGAVDWNRPGCAAVYRASLRQAQLAAALAQRVPSCDVEHAWVGGLLAPLGWLAVCAVDPEQVDRYRDETAAGRQQQAWGLDHTAIARRLSRLWRLPAWLNTIIGHLGLHVSIAARLGADPTLFQIVQLAVLLRQQREPGLGLAVGAELNGLLAALHLGAEEAETLAEQVIRIEPPATTWEAPSQYPLLADLLHLSLHNRRREDRAWVEELQRDLDRLQEALESQCAEEKQRLQAQKLAALAELAAGAGHEINNPLAVISGQAQYVLKQFELFDGPADEIEDVGEYLDGLRGKVIPSLHKIIGQTQRIHSILTDLMQFARPTTPRVQTVHVRALIQEVVAALQGLADERKVRLIGQEPTADYVCQGDPVQLRTALLSLLRNAVEAAPPDGWAGVRAEPNASGGLDLIVEDNGQGPSPAVREHLFDPFYSGRSAGRGRGMGLPTAWRLARQHGGDVRFDILSQGLTRFVLSLPSVGAGYTNGNGRANGRNGTHYSDAHP